MSSRSAPYYAGARLSKKFHAACPANQPLVEQLAEKREKAGSSHFGYTLKRAAESICKEKTPIVTYEQAIALKGVGPTIARSLGFSASFAADGDTAAGPKKGSRRRKDPPSRSASDAGSSGSTTSSVHSMPSAVAQHAPKKNPPGVAQTVLPSIKEKPSRKEMAYQKCLQESDSWKGKGLKWRLVLLIDQRERKAEHYASKVQQCGIPTDIRALPIGDMCWIAQGFEDDPTSVVTELMLGTIIERKEVSDLKSSLFGTRYHEQQLRLKHCGQPQVIFLIEGNTKKDQYRCPAETLHSTMWAIRIEKQNQVIQTAHTEETVQTLRRMHRRMLQRTFPSAFFAEALPSFTDTHIGSRRGQRSRDSFGEQRRKRRRRLESLHGLVFDEEPVPMAGMSRFVSYKELKAKVALDREAGRRTVGNIHQAMLKQVATISDGKILPICGVYPTANSLLKAYDGVRTVNERERFLEALDMSNGTVSRKVLGPRSAAEVSIAYGMDGNHSDSADPLGSSVAVAAQPAHFAARSLELSDSESEDIQAAISASLVTSRSAPSAPDSAFGMPFVSDSAPLSRKRCAASIRETSKKSSEVEVIEID